MAIIYLRASASAKDLYLQKELIDNLLSSKKMVLKKFYIEEISSDFESSRFNREIVHGNYKNEIIYVLSIDRISRDIEKIESILPLLTKKNMQIFSLRKNGYFTKDDVIVRKLFQECSKIEKEHFSKVTKDSLANLKKQGISLGKPPKFDRNELFENIVKAREIQNLTYAEIAKLYGLNASTICRVYNQGIQNNGFAERRQQELKKLIKIDLENNLTHQEILEKYNIPKTYLITISKEIKVDKDIYNTPLDIKQKIASEANAGAPIEELVEKHNIRKDVIVGIIKSMKGGANW